MKNAADAAASAASAAADAVTYASVADAARGAASAAADAVADASAADAAARNDLIAALKGAREMSDDLVKRLRQPWDADRSIMSQTGRWMVERKEAADRIEELEAANRGLVRLNEATEARAKTAEATSP